MISCLSSPISVWMILFRHIEQSPNYLSMSSLMAVVTVILYILQSNRVQFNYYNSGINFRFFLKLTQQPQYSFVATIDIMVMRNTVTTQRHHMITLSSQLKWHYLTRCEYMHNEKMAKLHSGFWLLLLLNSISWLRTIASEIKEMYRNSTTNIIFRLSQIKRIQKIYLFCYIRFFMYFRLNLGLFFIICREANISMRKMTKEASIRVQRQQLVRLYI